MERINQHLIKILFIAYTTIFSTEVHSIDPISITVTVLDMFSNQGSDTLRMQDIQMGTLKEINKKINLLSGKLDIIVRGLNQNDKKLDSLPTKVLLAIKMAESKGIFKLSSELLEAYHKDVDDKDYSYAIYKNQEEAKKLLNDIRFIRTTLMEAISISNHYDCSTNLGITPILSVLLSIETRLSIVVGDSPNRIVRALESYKEWLETAIEESLKRNDFFDTFEENTGFRDLFEFNWHLVPISIQRKYNRPSNLLRVSDVYIGNPKIPPVSFEIELCKPFPSNSCPAIKNSDFQDIQKSYLNRCIYIQGEKSKNKLQTIFNNIEKLCAMGNVDEHDLIVWKYKTLGYGANAEDVEYIKRYRKFHTTNVRLAKKVINIIDQQILKYNEELHPKKSKTDAEKEINPPTCDEITAFLDNIKNKAEKENGPMTKKEKEEFEEIKREWVQDSKCN